VPPDGRVAHEDVPNKQGHEGRPVSPPEEAVVAGVALRPLPAERVERLQVRGPVRAAVRVLVVDLDAVDHEGVGGLRVGGRLDVKVLLHGDVRVRVAEEPRALRLPVGVLEDFRDEGQAPLRDAAPPELVGLERVARQVRHGLERRGASDPRLSGELAGQEPHAHAAGPRVRRGPREGRERDLDVGVEPVARRHRVDHVRKGDVRRRRRRRRWLSGSWPHARGRRRVAYRTVGRRWPLARVRCRIAAPRGLRAIRREVGTERCDGSALLAREIERRRGRRRVGGVAPCGPPRHEHRERREQRQHESEAHEMLTVTRCASGCPKLFEPPCPVGQHWWSLLDLPLVRAFAHECLAARCRA